MTVLKNVIFPFSILSVVLWLVTIRLPSIVLVLSWAMRCLNLMTWVRLVAPGGWLFPDGLLIAFVVTVVCYLRIRELHNCL